MIAIVLSEYGYKEAAFGLGLSYGKTSDMDFRGYNDPSEQEKVMQKLAGKGNGHDKFLRMLTVTLDITAPMYWWKEFDTYKVGTVAQSESTMHTITKRLLCRADFEGSIDNAELAQINNLIESYKHSTDNSKLIWYMIINRLPMGFLQRRIVTTNYAALRNIISQRKGHKLFEWAEFIRAIENGVKHPNLLGA